MRKNIEKLFASNVTNYQIYKDTGISQSTLSNLKTGVTTLDSMKLINAEILSDYYIKNKEMLEMEKLFNRYLEERNDMHDLEIVESDMFVEITEQASQHLWYGRLSVAIEKAVFEDGTEAFVVFEEDDSEIVKQSRRSDEIYDKLVTLGESGMFTPIAAFNTIEDAESYIDKEYEVRDLEELVNEVLEDKKKEESL